MLLAKSPKDGCQPKGLAEHCAEVMDAFEVLFGTPGRPTRLARAWLGFFRLDLDDFERFHANGCAASGMHDLGKACDGFQAAVRGDGEQLLRHEHLSGLILALPQVEAWIGSNSLLDHDIIISAVVGHHLKASSRDEAYYREYGEPINAHGQTLILHSDHADFQACFAGLAQRIGMQPLAPSIPRVWSLSEGRGQSIDEGRRRIKDQFDVRRTRGLKMTPPRHRLLMAVKAAAVAADAAGSGLVRQNFPLRAWLTDAFKSTLTGNDIERHVIGARIRAVEARTGKPFAFQDFQERAADLPSRALLLAPCGSGKTLAAWRWIAARLKEVPRGHVLFLYPTRATATEGFRDYVSHAPEADAALLSGTARYELLDMFDNPDDARHGRNYLTEQRLYALGFWQKRIFSATVDQFFGFLQQGYGGICLLPVLADSVIVIDEVHSFDVGLFSALVKFLEYFDVPVLCMTASLPVRRRETLEALGLEVFPKRGQEFDDLDRKARLPRYRVEVLAGPADAEDIARRAIAARRRVLWVVNTVDRCQALASGLADLRPLCYHSRFTLDDRNLRHKAVIAALGPDSAGAMALTTQVCEMSLDLDAQVLITETAPIPALIQRMGRCNRLRPEESLGEVFIYSPEASAPYRKEEMDSGCEFVRDIAGKRVSQVDLSDLLEGYTSEQEAEGERLVAFVEDGFWSRGSAEDLRDSEDFTVPAVLDSEVERYLALRRKGQPTDGLVLPVPRKAASRDKRLPGFLYVAPSSHYVAELGFLKEMPSRERAVVL